MATLKADADYNAKIKQIANGMLSHLNTSLQTSFVVSRAKYNVLVEHQFGHTASPSITANVRVYLGSLNYLMTPQGRSFRMAGDVAKPAPAICQWSSKLLRLRDSLVEDFEHNGHPEYVIPQDAFQARVKLFYNPVTFDGRFMNMFRDLMKGSALRASFIGSDVRLSKASLVPAIKTVQKPVTVQTNIPKKQWAGIIKGAVQRISDRLKQSSTFNVCCTHEQFRELITFWPSEPEFMEQLNKALSKNGQKAIASRSVVRISFDHIGCRAPEGKAQRAPKVIRPIAKVFNAQALFAVIDKCFREHMGDISHLRWADDYTHTVTLCEYGNSDSDYVTVHFVEADVRIAGRNVDSLVMRSGDIVLTNDAGAKQFRNAVRHINSAPCRMCNVRKLQF